MRHWMRLGLLYRTLVRRNFHLCSGAVLEQNRLLCTNKRNIYSVPPRPTPPKPNQAHPLVTPRRSQQNDYSPLQTNARFSFCGHCWNSKLKKTLLMSRQTHYLFFYLWNSQLKNALLLSRQARNIVVLCSGIYGT